MTRTISSDNNTALQQRRLVARDFLWLQVRDRTTGDPVVDGEWSDIGTITVNVIDPETGGSVSRQYFGSGTLISISAIPLVSNITVQNVTVTLGQCADRVNDLVRTYDCKQGLVQVHRGLFDPSTRVLVAPAEVRFAGYIDTIEIVTPTENSEGAVTLTCTSNTQELTRSNSDTRSDASQRLRSATDDFFNDVAVVGAWQFFWGKASGAVT